MTDEIPLNQAQRLVRELTCFVGAGRLAKAQASLRELRKGANEFRQLMIDEKHWLLNGVERFNKRTLNGSRKFTPAMMTDDVFMVLYHASMLRRVAQTLPPKLAENQRGKLLNLHGKGASVTMEWEQASFFLRHGYELNWTDANVVGCEFIARAGQLSIECECRGFGRNAVEKMRDADRTNLAHGIFEALRELNLVGCAVVKANECTGVDSNEVKALCLAFLQPGVVRQTLQIGSFCSIDLDQTACKADPVALQGLRGDNHRSMGYLFIEPNKGHATSIFIEGPRMTAHEHVADILATMKEKAAKQFSRQLPAFLVVQLSAVSDPEIFRGIFAAHAPEFFAEFPFLFALVWRTPTTIVQEPTGPKTEALYFAIRNANCTFDYAKTIRLGDEVANLTQDFV